ncbi:MAG: TonB-dependent receptor [Mangrovibacterium sp.]
MKKTHKYGAWYEPTLKKTLLIMRLVLILSLVCVMQSFALKAFTQNSKISFSVKEMKLEELITQIESQTKYRFAYNRKEIDVNKSYSVNLHEMNIVDALKQIFGDKQIQYKIFDRQIVLSSVVTSASQQSLRVSGRVTDSAGLFLPGVSVTVKGTTSGTTTDFDGNYSFLDIPSDVTLVFSFVGMKTQEIVVAGNTVINVTMVEDAIGIEEVVAIGYGTVKKSDLTGSVSHIESNTITQTKSADVVTSLKGRVAGIDIVNTGNKPGSTPEFVIRGYNSLSASNTPLIVLDGVPFNGSLTDINNSDINSIDILKDASSTAIYGARGANGVIIITTKRGDKKEGFAIKYEGYYGISRNFKNFDMMDGAQYADFKRAAYPEFNEDELIFSQTELNSIANQSYTDWQDLMFSDTGYKTESNINVNFNTAKSTNSISFGYYKDQSIIKNMSFERFNVKVTGDIEFSSKLSAGYNIMSSFSNADLGSNNLFLWGTLLDPLSKPYDAEGNLQFYPSEWNQTVLQSNPLYDLDDKNLERNNKRNNIILNSYLRWEIIKGLSYQFVVSPEIHNVDYGQYFGKLNSYRQNGTNSADWRKTNSFTVNINNKLNYLKEWKEHKLDISLLQDFQQYKSTSIYLSGEDIPYYGKWYNVNEAPEKFSRDSYYTTWSILSYMGRLNYSYKGKYLLTATGRYDGASVLAENHKWDFFPSVALAWRISEESFVKNLNVFDNLKLRLSWGNSGNSAIDAYSTLGALGATKYVFGTSESVAPGYVATSLPNSSLGWEKTEEYNLGLDFGVLKSRLSGSVDAYVRNTYDLLMSRQLPITSGYGSTMQNIGKTRNTGIELTLNTIPIDKSNFKWRLDFTGSYNKNEIVELYGAKEDDPGNKWFIGKPIYVDWIFNFEGIWQTGEEEAAKVYGAVPGNAKYTDVNDDGKYTSEDYFIYNRIPKYNVGLNSTFEYKNFDLTLNFYGRLDYGFRIGALTDQGGRSSARYGQLDINYWTPDNPSNEAPRPTKTEGDNRVGNSTYAFRDLSFIRLNNIILGYNIKNKGKLPFRNARAYLTVDNPYVYTFQKDFEGLDPENCTSFGDHRPLTTFLVGLNINF